MIHLPSLRRDPKAAKDVCKCRPVCKNRRREWKGVVKNTSEELLLERKQLPECFRRRPTKVVPCSPCPLVSETHRVTLPFPRMVRICQASVDNMVDKSYLKYADIAKHLGAWSAVRPSCLSRSCYACCPCAVRDYIPHDAERAARRRSDMREFDARVNTDYLQMRIVYNKP